jgi:hypothetical protein
LVIPAVTVGKKSMSLESKNLYSSWLPPNMYPKRATIKRLRGTRESIRK